MWVIWIEEKIFYFYPIFIKYVVSYDVHCHISLVTNYPIF